MLWTPLEDSSYSPDDKNVDGTRKGRLRVYGMIVDLRTARVPKELSEELSRAWKTYRLFVSSMDGTTKRT